MALVLLPQFEMAARKLANLSSDTTGPTPAKLCAVEDAIDQAKFILERIEARWPERR